MLGYPNEYGLLTDRPLLASGADPAGLLPRDAGTGAPDLGRNGTYLVLRTLRQDVAAFHAFTEAATRDAAGRPDPDAAGAAGGQDGRPLAQRRAAVAGTRTRRPLARRQQRLRLPGQRPRAAWPARSGRTSGVPTRATRSSRSPAPRPRWPSTAGTGCCGAAAATAHRTAASAACSSSSSTRTSPGSTSSSSTPGSTTRCSTSSRTRPTRWSGRAGPSGATSPRRPARPAAATRELPQFVHVRGGAYFFLPGIRALRFLAGARSSTT